MTFKPGPASHDAAQDIRRQVIERAARIWKVDPEAVEYLGGILQHKEDSELRMTLKQLARRLNATAGPVVGRAAVNPSGVGNAFALHVVDVEVDPETGKVDILRFTAFQDAGKAVHPAMGRARCREGRSRASVGR